MPVAFRKHIRFSSWILAVLCGGCSAIVDTSGLPIRCEIAQGADPCSSAGMTCVAGTCQADTTAMTMAQPTARTTINRFPSRQTSSTTPTSTGTGTTPSNPTTPTTPTIMPVAAGAPGATCKMDSDCAQGFCMPAPALMLGGSAAGGSICGTACCRDTDCPADHVCFESSTGARACLPAGTGGRQRGDGGKTCSRGTQCSSGMCTSGKCVATCVHDADCPGEVCHLNVTASNLGAGAAGFICGMALGRGDPGDPCTSFDPTACKSGICTGAQCAAPCGADLDCTGGLACRYITIAGLLGVGRVSACVQPDQASPAPAPICCTSADCAGGACVPMGESGGDWGLYCGALSMVQ